MQELKILAIGDCNTSGKQGVVPAFNVPGIVTSMFEHNGTNAHLTNLGHTMCTSREGILKISREGIGADVLLLNFGLVDSWFTSIPSFYVLYYPDNTLRKTGRKLLKILKKKLRLPMIKKFFPSGHVVDPEEYKQNMEEIINIARKQNNNTKIMIWSTTLTRSDLKRNEYILAYNKILQDISNKGGYLYVDTNKALEKLQDEIYLDEVHLSASAAKVIATEIFEKLASDRNQFI